MWYPRHMLQTRMGLFWGGATLAGAFSGLLAFGISFMDGVAGLEGWSWIFVSRSAYSQSLSNLIKITLMCGRSIQILEGMVTVVVGIIAFFGTSLPANLFEDPIQGYLRAPTQVTF